MKVGEVYKIDVAALDAALTEHPHQLVRGKVRDVHAVTVLAVSPLRIVSVECECGAQWVYEDIGAVHDARYRPNRDVPAPRERPVPKARQRAAYGRRAR